MVSDLYNKDNFIINAKVIKSTIITEYDISKANISVLLDRKIISKDLYDYLYRLPKIDREIYIGNKIRTEGKSVYNEIKAGIINAKMNLFKFNNIQNNEIIRIANDAVYVMRNLPLQYTKFGIVEFKTKNVYSTFIRIGGLSILFGSLMGDINIDIIGLGKEQNALHLDYMITFLGNLLYLVENSTIEQVMDFYLNFYNQYIKRKLNIGFYREFNEISMYTVRSLNNNKYGMTFTDDINQLDISYNAGFLRELYGILVGIYKN